MVASTSSLIGLMNMAASSTYMEVLYFAAISGRGIRITCCVAKSSKRWRGSIAKMKSMGESGSP